MTCRAKHREEILVFFPCVVSKTEQKFRLEKIEPVVLAIWKGMKNYTSAKNETFYDIPVKRRSNEDEIFDRGGFIVEVHFRDRGRDFDSDLVAAMRTLKGRWGREAKLRLSKFSLDKSKSQNKNIIKAEDNLGKGFFDAVT